MGCAPDVILRAAPILVVDDQPGLRTVVQAGLKHFGYDADVAGSVTEAKQRLRSRHYSLVLADYEMPGGNGLELLEYVSAVYPDLPFVLMTAYDETPLACSAIRHGALDFLAKPFELRQLERLIEQNQARLVRDRERVASLTDEVLTGTIRALVAAVDAKDPHTATHSERVTRLAIRVGQALELPDERMRVLEFAALLHDVGKIAVPEQILVKTDELTEEEWEVVREHPVRSAEIVSQVAPLAEVATIVRHHHEKMDGSGYPDGLSGEAIPPFSRLIALADVYEALTSNRSYRKALRPAKAREVMRGKLGSHFDPALGSVFLSIEDLP